MLNPRPPRRLAWPVLLALLTCALAAIFAAQPAVATPISPPGGGESFDIHPGDSFRVGYDFTIPGNSQPVTVTWTNPQAVVNFTCPGGGSGSFTISMPDYTVTVSDGQWYPSGDQSSPLVYQGSVTAPDGCGGGAIMHQDHIATFTADVTSSPSVEIHYRFHDVDNNASGSWSSTGSVMGGAPLTQTIQSEIYQCVNGAPTSTLVSGGSITVPAANLSSANPLPPTQVPADTYTVNAAAPAGQEFVACGQSGVTITAPDTAHQSVIVPPGGAGDGKFYVQATQPPGTGYLEICKSNANSVSGKFQFYVPGHKTVTVLAGACSAPIKVSAGVQLVEELDRDGYAFVSVSANPADRVVNIDPTRHNISVRIVAGGIANEVIVTFVNTHTTGTVKICQVAGSGVPGGTQFGFTNSAVGGVTYVPAGKSAGGRCVVLGSFWQAYPLTITQQIPGGDSVGSIKVKPAARLVGTPDLVHGSVTIKAGPGVTEVTYTDTSP